MPKMCVDQVEELTEQVKYLVKVLQGVEKGVMELDDIHWNPRGRSFTDCRREICDDIDIALDRVKLNGEGSDG